MIEIIAPATKDVLALLRRGEVRLDGLMVPQTLGKMATLLRSDFPELPLHAHLSQSMSDPSPLPRPVVDGIVEFVQLAEAVRVSAHLGYNCSEVVRTETGIAPAPKAQKYVPASARRTIVSNVKLLRDLLGKEISLENLSAVGRGPVQEACGFVCEPGFIRQVLERAECGLVLDLAHARVSAAHLHMETTAYLEQVPLDRVVALHISGPRKIEGRLADAHDTLAIEDFHVLDWVLERCSPETVVVEYAADRAEIPAQVDRVRRECERRRG